LERPFLDISRSSNAIKKFLEKKKEKRKKEKKKEK